MCGLAGIAGPGATRARIEAMVIAQRHRGPDGEGVFVDAGGRAALGHDRLSIIDLSMAGQQPMASADGRFRIVFNGEVYNYLELRQELSDWSFTSHTDSEVVLAAYARWGEACLERLLGMFVFVVWDEVSGRLFAARDRFGVKPLHYHLAADGTLLLASEIKALHAAGVAARPDPVAWASYLGLGLSDHSERSFWQGISRLPAGHWLAFEGGRFEQRRWYDVAARTLGEPDRRAESVVLEEYRALLGESVRLRFRSDVPVGINLSGGLDSSILLALVQAVRAGELLAFTFVTGDPAYDELPWVEQMLRATPYRSVACRLTPGDVPALFASVAASEDEPFGGLPTLAYALVFEQARTAGVKVLLDGQGMDEQWAGYDYYAQPAASPRVQGSRSAAVRPECLRPEFLALAEPLPESTDDSLTARQVRDIVSTKLPRALRFNDRISMRASRELREPFLDHRLVELALRQPPERKIQGGVSKLMLRRLARELLPEGIALAPKRPVQTPQREWLRGPLRGWAQERIENAIATHGDWLDAERVRTAWADYQAGASDNSHFIWQWSSVAPQGTV